VIGGVQTANNNKLKNLANLLANDDLFDSAFKKNHVEDKKAIKINKGKPVDHMESLLQSG
jgi:hypothetical protein